MKSWIDEKTGLQVCEPDCADEWLWHIWALGADYDGCGSVEHLKNLIDEIVEMAMEARKCLRENKLFSNDSK